MVTYFVRRFFSPITSFLDYFTLPFFTISEALPFRRIQSSIHALVLIRIFSSWNEVFFLFSPPKQTNNLHNPMFIFKTTGGTTNHVNNNLHNTAAAAAAALWPPVGQGQPTRSRSGETHRNSGPEEGEIFQTRVFCLCLIHQKRN